MARISYLPVREIKPIVRLMVERNKYGELLFPESKPITSQEIEESLLLLHYGINPSLTMMDNQQGGIIVLNGSRFIRSVVEFVGDMHLYPDDGRLESLRGKRFSELTRSEQRTILTAEMSITLCADESDLFSGLSKIAQRLS